MGVCFSAQVKAECSNYSGSIDKYESTDACVTDSISNSSKVTLLIPVTPDLHNCESGAFKLPDMKSFTFADLKLATRNFRPENSLGGAVFKGWVDEQTLSASKPGTGVVIAIKRLKHKSFRGHKEWLAEVDFLGHLHHPNLVKMVGYCVEDEKRILVYEFAARGSLENHLFMRGSYFQPLPWNLRLKVALGVANGLAFLHSPKVNITYADFKTSNILLDLNYNAKLSDIGVPKATDDENSLIVRYSARVIHTDDHEYSSPDYTATGYLSAKSNVYTFGIVLLEILSGRRAIDKNRPRNEINLVEWAKPYLARKVNRIIDNRLEGQYKMDTAQKLATLALLCLSINFKNRPTMEQVVKALEKLYDPNETSPARTKPTRTRSTEVSARAKSATM